MNSTVISVENISKLYRLGEVGTGTLSHDLNRWWHKVRGKEDPYLKIGQSNDRTKKADSDYVWALKDISFEVKRGEVLGIIGRNGAGKSTLLKILSRVTTPTSGEIKVKGRIASLLEVGTGFNPELTGRENIYLNGAILGMRKVEISRKFDEIVAFAEVVRYIDTPVKRYSSGMYVRLAFAVAAHLEPEILIVDEVLAVGDAEFQRKCLGKMSDVSSHGRTVVFVSHNMAAMLNLCNRIAYVQNGQLVGVGKPNNQIAAYTKDTETRGANDDKALVITAGLELRELSANPNSILSGQGIDFTVKLHSDVFDKLVDLTILVYSQSGVRVAIIDLRNTKTGLHFRNGLLLVQQSISAVPLVEGTYKLGLYIKSDSFVADIMDIHTFQVMPFHKPNSIIPHSAIYRGFIELN